MATYKETVGTAVVNYAGNYPGAVDGELWYDSTNKDFKYQYANVTTESWASGGNLNTARSELAAAGNAILWVSLVFGGEPSPGHTAKTELYGGSSWTEVNDLNTSRRILMGAGTTTAALAFGGFNGPPGTQNVDNTETWNGTNWTEVNDINTARRHGAGNGTNSSDSYWRTS